MRALHIATSFPSGSEDASGPFVLRLMEAMEKRGTTCHVLTPATTYPTQWPDPEKVHRFRYAPWKMQILAQQPGGIPVALKKNPLSYGLVLPFLFNMGMQISSLARGFDVIHAHWSICGAIAVLTQSFHKKPVVTTLHGSDHHRGQEKGAYSWLHKKAIQGSAFTVGVSQTILEQLKEQEESCYIDRLCFIPNGVTDAFYEVHPDKSSPQQPLRLLIIGSLIPRKGVDIVIKSLAKVSPDVPWKLTVLGEGAELESLKTLASDRRISEHIDFHGVVSPGIIPDFMEKHHVLILPSYKEGRPSVVLEAMAAAMAVVATDIDGTRELVQDGDTGWLFPPGDDDGLAKIITSIHKGQKDINKAGLAGRQWMLEHKLTWAETASQYQKLYEKVVGRASS